ncbi:MAG: flavin reductase, partial [Eubacterium sp.]|nr:flavin reductase [Eubacterium sp.]
MKEINVRDIKENVVKLIANDWALLTAKDGEGCNPMTVSWGGIGELWGKDTATVYVRESRYTKGLIDNETHFSLCFFKDENKDALKFCGVKSGRDYDKVKETGLTPVYDENAPYFEESKIVLICRKMACQLLDEKSFIDSDIMEKWYRSLLYKTPSPPDLSTTR